MYATFTRRLSRPSRSLMVALCAALLLAALCMSVAQAASRFSSAPKVEQPISLQLAEKAYEDAYDPTTGLLYAVDITGSGKTAQSVIKVIYTASATTASTGRRYVSSSGQAPAAGTVVDTISTNADQVLGLGIDPAQNLLYGSGTRTDSIVAYNINPSAGNSAYDQVQWRTAFVPGQNGISDSAGASSGEPRDMTLGAGAYANDLYVAIPLTQQVVDLNATTGAISKVFSSEPATGSLDPEASTTSVLFDPDNNLLYTTNCETCDQSPDSATSGTLSVIDPSSASGSHATQVISGLNLQPVNAAYDPATKQIYVTAQGANLHNGNGSSDGYLDVIDANPADNGTGGTKATYDTVIKNIDLGNAVDPLGVTDDSADGVVYVPEYGAINGGVVLAVNAATDQVIKTVNVGAQPLHVAIDPSTHVAYVTNQASNTVSEITPGASSAGLTVSPSTATAGSSVTVAGTGFAAGHTVAISVGGLSASTSPATITAGSDGSFTTTVTVPTGLTGAQTLTGTDSAGHSVSRAVEVTGTCSSGSSQTVTLSPTSVAAGKAITVAGVGFQAGQVIQAVKLDQGAVIGGSGPGGAPFATADSCGDFSGTATVPTGTTAGTHTLTELGSTPAAVSLTQSFTVTGTSAAVRVSSHAVKQPHAAPPSSFGVTATISLTPQEAYQIAYNPTTGLLYVADVGLNTIDVIYTASATTTSTDKLYVSLSGAAPAANTVVARIPFGPGQADPAVPYGLTVNPKTNRLLATSDLDGTAYMLDVDPSSSNYDKVIASYDFSKTGDRSATVDEQHDLWFVANPEAATVTEINGQTNRIVRKLSAKRSAKDKTTGVTASVAYDPQTKLLYATDGAPDEQSFVKGPTKGKVSVIAVGTGKLVKQITVGKDPVYISFDPNSQRLFVANENYGHPHGTVSVIDANPGSPTDNTVVATTTVGADPIGATVDAGDGLVYVTNFAYQGTGGGTVSVLDAYSGARLWSVGVGREPDMAAVDPATHLAYVTNLEDATVSVIDPTTPAKVLASTTKLSVRPAHRGKVGKPVVLIAKVKHGGAGWVTFYDATKRLRRVRASAGKATFKTKALKAGAHHLKAVFTPSEDTVESSVSNGVDYREGK